MSAVNQHLVNSYIYCKCLKNDRQTHDKKNDYCISSLYGGVLNAEDKTVDFPNGAFIAITSNNQNLLNSIIEGVLNNPDFYNGMKHNGFDFVSETFFNGWNHFATLSPFIIRKFLDKKSYSFYVIEDKSFLQKANDKTLQKIIPLNDVDFSKMITEHTISKIKAVSPNADLKDFKIEVKSHNSHKIKVIKKQYDHETERCVINYANQCQISVYCNKSVAEIIYTIGIGQSTGCGFGTIYKTENHKKYKFELIGLKK